MQPASAALSARCISHGVCCKLRALPRAARRHAALTPELTSRGTRMRLLGWAGGLHRRNGAALERAPEKAAAALRALRSLPMTAQALLKHAVRSHTPPAPGCTPVSTQSTPVSTQSTPVSTQSTWMYSPNRSARWPESSALSSTFCSLVSAITMPASPIWRNANKQTSPRRRRRSGATPTQGKQ